VKQEQELEERKTKIMPGGRAMILAYDQGFEHGPRDFVGHPESANSEYILDIAKRGKFTGIVLHAGLAEKYESEIRDSKVPLILKLNGTSELKEFSRIIREAHGKGIPVIGWMYPRGKSLFDRSSASKTLKMALEEQGKTNLAIDETPSIVAYGARIGLELGGADIVKVKYTGSPESFRWVVQSAFPTKVVMSGGPMTKTDEGFLSRVKDVLTAGAVGIAVGRNVWQRKDPLIISEKIHQIIFGS